MTQRKCVLHIGMLKTASSSIQATLSSNHERLRNKWQLDSYHMLENQSFVAGFVEDTYRDDLMFLNLGGPLEEERHAFCDLLRTDFISHLSGSLSRTYIISGEILCLLEEPAVERLKAFLQPYFDEIKVVIYVREHLHCFSSLAQQAVKAGKSFDHIKIRSSATPKNKPSTSDFSIVPTYQRMISDYRKHFGEENVIIRDFTALSQSGIDVARDFLNVVLGIEDNALKTVRLNESLDHTVTHILEGLNRSTPLFVGNYLNPKRARTLTARLKQIRAQTKFVMHSVDWGSIRAKTLEDAAWLKDATAGQIDYTGNTLPTGVGPDLGSIPIDGLGVEINASLLEAERAKQRAAILSGLAGMEALAESEESLMLSPFAKVCLVHTDVKFLLNIAQRLKKMKRLKLAHMLVDNVRRVSPEPEDHEQAEKFLTTLPQPHYNAAKLRFDLRIGASSAPTRS